MPNIPVFIAFAIFIVRNERKLHTYFIIIILDVKLRLAKWPLANIIVLSAARIGSEMYWILRIDECFLVIVCIMD